MRLTELSAINPLDGRYQHKLKSLSPIFSEFGLIKYRLITEINWLKFIAQLKIIKLKKTESIFLDQLIKNFDLSQAKLVKKIEQKTNHDVKAIEYYLKQKLSKHKHLHPFIHFACTSADINNVAYALMLKDGLQQLMPSLSEVIGTLKTMANQFSNISMLALTHGQPASPTTLGKELANFAYRLEKQQLNLAGIPITAKFNGATGNYNAHHAALPKLNWPKLSKQFISSLGLSFQPYSTQIEPHDNLAQTLQSIQLINTIAIDLNRDIWSYISRNYFKLSVNDNEVGSSTMPHKVNPIDFENAEGNLGLANALCQHFANKLPISRLQRDLSDSTVMRNLGVIFGYTLLAYQSSLNGLNKLTPNQAAITAALEAHPEVITEAIQTVMRKHGIADAYEQLKAFSRGKAITLTLLHSFIKQLPLPADEKKRLLQLTPASYSGLAQELAKNV